MSRDDLIYIGHMLDTCHKALSRIEGKTREQFDSNEDLQIVLTHLIQVGIIRKTSTQKYPMYSWRSGFSDHHGRHP